MAGSSEEENQKAYEMEKLILQEDQYPHHNEQLAQMLRQVFVKSAKEMRAFHRAEKKKKASGNALSTELLASIQRPEDTDVSPMMNQRKQGRKRKNEMVAEKVVCFSLPENCDIESIKDIDKVQERLGKWRIQRRQRDSKMTDMYYCHLSSRQTFRSIPEAVSFMMCESQPKPSPKKNKCENKTSDQSISSKKARKNKEKLEELSYESFEISNNLEKSDYGLGDTYMSKSYEEFSPDDALNYVEGKTTEEILLEFETFNDLHHLISDANEKENGKENSTEMQAQIATNSENVEFIMTEANDQGGPKLEDKGTDVVQEMGGKENFKQEFETLEEALEKIGNIEIEGIDEAEDHYPKLQDLTMDWAASDSILDKYFDECDLVNHIPVCESVPELVEFLINNRKK